MAETSNIDKIIADLGANYKDDKKVLEEILEEVSSIASDISNRQKNDEKLFPYVKKATKAIYLSRGAEGLTSRNEGSISASFEDIIDKLRNDIIKSGLRRIKLLRDLTKVYILEYEEIEDHGETEKKWKYKGIAWLNTQQDVSELDRKSTGEVDYSTYKARTTKDYDIQKGDGISFKDISELEEFKPQYKVTDKNKIGSTYLYICEKVQE